MRPPFGLPIPIGSNERQRQQLLHDWLASEVQVRRYSKTVGGLIVDGSSDLAERKRRANGLLVEASIKLRDCRSIIDGQIANLKAQGKWESDWPENAEGIVRFTLDILDDQAMGLWPLVIGAVLVLLAAGVAIALMSLPLSDIYKIIEQMPSFGDIVDGSVKIGGVVLALTVAAGGLYLLFGSDR